MAPTPRTSVPLRHVSLPDGQLDLPALRLQAERRHLGVRRIDAALYQRIRGNWRFFAEGNNLTGRGWIQDENVLNDRANRRTELFGRTVLAGIQMSF